MLLLWGPQQGHTRSCIVLISSQTFTWYGNALALLHAPLTGKDFSHLSFCCALWRCLKLYDSSASLFLFLVCLLLETTRSPWAGMCHRFLPMWSALCACGPVAMNLLPRAACFKSWSAKRSQCLLCKETLQMKHYSSSEGKKHGGRKCRCDWRMLLQKWTLYLGKPWSCSLCKYKAVNWIETSLEKQERKNGLSWGNSPCSKQREIVTGHAKAAIFGFQPPKNWPRSLPWNKTGWRAVYEWP